MDIVSYVSEVAPEPFVFNMDPFVDFKLSYLCPFCLMCLLILYRFDSLVMSSTSQKHRNFVQEPMGEKSVSTLAGIGYVLGGRLVERGFDKVNCDYIKIEHLVFAPGLLPINTVREFGMKIVEGRK